MQYENNNYILLMFWCKYIVVIRPLKWDRFWLIIKMLIQDYIMKYFNQTAPLKHELLDSLKKLHLN